MAKRKAGLHRKVSSIFDGVTVPGSDKSGSKLPPVQEQENQKKVPAPAELQKSAGPPKKTQPHSNKEPEPKRRKRKRYKFSASTQNAKEQNEKKKIMFMVALVIILVFVMIKTFLPMLSKNEGEKSKAEEIMAKALRQKIDTIIVWEIPEVYPAKLRDPMRTGRFFDPVTGEWVDEIADAKKPGDTAEMQNDAESAGFYGKIAIQSILYSEQGRSIVIGNKILYEGNDVEGAVIIKINKNSVVFSMGGQQFEVSLQ